MNIYKDTVNSSFPFKTCLILVFLLLFNVSNGISQVKSGLDLCLRDEQTGEWLIGLFDDFAVYNCEYWDYAKAGKDRVVLVNGCERLDVQLKKNATIINGKKHKTSVLTSTFMPDYPTKEDTSFSDDINAKERDATIRIFCRRRNKGMPFNFYYQPLLGENEIDDNWQLDSLGRAEKKVPIACETYFNAIGFPTYDIIHGTGEHSNWHGWLGFVLKPGERVMVFIDDDNKRVYAMGDGARLTNEMAAYYFPNVSVDYETRKSAPIEEYLQQSDELYKKNVHKLDSILAVHPFASNRYRTLMSEDLRYRMVSGIVQLMFYHQNDSLRPVFAKYITPDVLTPRVPLSVEDDILYVYSQYASFIERDTNIALKIEDVVKEAVRQGVIQMDDELRELVDGLQLLNDSAQVLKDAGQEEEYMAFYKRHQSFYERAGQIYEDRGLLSVASNMMMDKFYERSISILDSLDITPKNREILKARYFYELLEELGDPYSKTKLDLLQQEVHEPYLLNGILRKNEEFIAIAEAAKVSNSTSLMTNEPLKDLKEGEEIFRKIVEPYRGSYVYIDIWGTWCRPCKEEMKYVPELKEALKDKNVVYLYLCNQSSEESWRNNIERYHLAGEHCIHYNLPDAQQSALENYIDINGYPTYKLVTPDGQLLPGMAPRPSDAEAVKMMIDELEKP